MKTSSILPVNVGTVIYSPHRLQGHSRSSGILGGLLASDEGGREHET